MQPFSDTVSELYKRFSYIQKSGTNSHFRYQFVRESDLKATLNRALRELGMRLDMSTAYTGDAKLGVAKVTLTIRSSDGMNIITLTGIGGGMDSGDKAPQKALQSAFKYALLCGFAIETGEDSESDYEANRHIDDLLGDIAEAPLAEMTALKVRVAEFKGSPRFGELVAAYKGRAARIEDGGYGAGK